MRRAILVAVALLIGAWSPVVFAVDQGDMSGGKESQKTSGEKGEKSGEKGEKKVNTEAGDTGGGRGEPQRYDARTKEQKKDQADWRQYEAVLQRLP